jgi:hypothetical protein
MIRAITEEEDGDGVNDEDYEGEDDNQEESNANE